MSRPRLSDNILNPDGWYDFVWCVIRKKGRGEFWDVDSVGLTKASALKKAALVDEMKPEWAKAHPVVRVARGKFVEEPDPSLVRE